MPASEAQIRANQQNAAQSTEPKTEAGKEQSRRNGLKHGMAGAGVVLIAEDLAEVSRRNEALQVELAPKSSLGEILVLQMATLSVRMERGATQEFASIASRVRNATEEFDEARFQQTEALFERLGDEPREIDRLLRKTPEGAERLVSFWTEISDELNDSDRPGWTSDKLQRVAKVSEILLDDLKASRFVALVRATWGYLGDLEKSEREGLEPSGVRAWAKSLLVEKIDAEIAGLRTHYATLDHAMIEQDRLGAADRALFDPSKAAILARRYESEARRGFFKALYQFRKVEAEAAERLKSVEVEAAEPMALASSRENEPREVRDPRPAPPMAARNAPVEKMVVDRPRNRSKMADRTAIRAG
jgi:hypothetical protein